MARLPNYLRSNRKRLALSQQEVAFGFGYAVFEGPESILECGIKTARWEKNAQALRKIGKLVFHFNPAVLVLENTDVTGSRRSPRIRELGQEIIALAKSRKIKVKLFSRDRVLKTIIPDRRGTKHAMAEIIARRFPEQLATQLPPERALWDSESPRMAMFEAVALALVFQMTQTR